MKCYNHENLDAVGICKNCGIAVCKSCSVLFEEKLLCIKCRDKTEQISNTPLISQFSNKIQQLIEDFDYYLEISKKAIGINTSWREGVIEHIKVIDMIRKSDDYKALIQEDYFLKAVHNTLIEWGMNKRGARIKKFDDFKENILDHIDIISELRKYELEKLSDLNQIHDQVLLIFNLLNVMVSKAKLVSVSKALAHFLPDLIPPMDNQNVYTFFYDDKSFPSNPKAEAKKFWEILEKFHYIQKKVGLSKKNHKFEGFNTSVPKMIDNAIWGFIYEQKLKIKSTLDNKAPNKLEKEYKANIPVWTMIANVINDLGKEFTNQDIINAVINKYSDVNKNTLQRNIYLLTVNNPLRIHWGYNQKVRIANSKYDLLFKNEKNKLEIYNPEKNGIWEIIRVGNKFNINLKKAPHFL